MDVWMLLLHFGTGVEKIVFFLNILRIGINKMESNVITYMTFYI